MRSGQLLPAPLAAVELNDLQDLAFLPRQQLAVVQARGFRACPKRRFEVQRRCRYLHVVAFERVSVDHRVMGGVPCIRGTRMPVSRVIKMLAADITVQDVLAEFPQLDLQDVHEALLYAAAAVTERELPLRPSA